MSLTMRLSARVRLMLALAAISTATAGCAGFHKYHGAKLSRGEVKLDLQLQQTDLSIRISPDGRLEAVDKRTGKPLTYCTLCTEAMEDKLGRKCTELVQEKPELCRSLIGKTVDQIDSFIVIQSHASPGCTTIWYNGKPYQYCN
jgi:hypothetical protein